MTATHAAPDANDILFGSNAATAKFSEPGTTIGGLILRPPRAYQEREYVEGNPGGGNPKTFPSGDPIMGINIDVQTNVRDASVPDDDGIRTLYIEGKRLKDAVRDGVRQAGAQKLEVGAEIYVTFTHREDPMDKRSAKHYTVRYVPVAQAAVGLGQQVQPQQQPYGQQTPQQGYQQPQQAYGQPPAQQYASPVQQQPQQAYQPPQQQAPAQQYAPPAQQAYSPPVQPQQPVQQPPAQQSLAGPTSEQIAGLLATRTDPRLVFPDVQLTPEQLAQVASFAQPQG
jgi:hypothetical protein